MATGTAWYNLTKPASNENYNVGIWNTNLDMIDAQMHQNETEVFGGATSLANGTVGNVPAPLIADKDKYLKGDGTWDTPSGGGGSTVTITPTLATGRKIAEYEIDGTNGSLFAPLVEITGEASGSIATFTDGADGKPVKNLEISIEPVQSGSGDPSPSNVRPISGWSGANVYRRGYNIWDEEWESGSYDDRSGEKVPNNSYIRSKNAINVVPSTTYCATRPAGGLWLGFYDINGVYLSKINTVGGVFTTPNDAYYLRLHTYGSYGTTYNNDISINYPSTDTEYHAYNGSTTSIPFHDSSDNPITVYGGTLNVTSGELRITMASVDLGTLIWENAGMGSSAPTGHHAYVCNGFGAKYSGNDYTPPNLICSQYVAVSRDDTYRGTAEGFAINALEDLYAYIAEYATGTASAFKTAMNGVQLVYPLATPQTYQLTPTQVSTLLGQNNIFADCGDVEEVVYVRDINLAFNQLEARVAALEGSNSRSVSLTKSAPIEETKEETKEEEPNEVKEKEEKDDN